MFENIMLLYVLLNTNYCIDVHIQELKKFHTFRMKIYNIFELFPIPILPCVICISWKGRVMFWFEKFEPKEPAGPWTLKRGPGGCFAGLLGGGGPPAGNCNLILAYKTQLRLSEEMYVIQHTHLYSSTQVTQRRFYSWGFNCIDCSTSYSI